MGRRGGCQPCQPQYVAPESFQQPGGSSCEGGTCYPSVSDQQQYQRQAQDRRGGRCGTPGDGFEIINPTGNNFGTPENYNKAVAGTFKYTDQNYDQALKDAARKGQPVVAVFGSKDCPDTQKLLDTVQKSQQAGGKDRATYVYIEMDRVRENPNSGLAKFSEGIRKDNLAHTILFTQKPDANGNPVPEAAMMTAWGGRDQIANTINTHIGYGEQAMRGRQFNIKPEAEPGAEAKKDVGKEVKDVKELPMEERIKRNLALHQEIMTGLSQGNKATDWKEGEKHYKAAIAASDKVDKEAVKSELKRVEDLLSKGADEAKTKELNSERSKLKLLEGGDWLSRASMGFSCMKWNPNFRDVGEQWLIAAGDKNPAMYDSATFKSQLKTVLNPEQENAFMKRAVQHEINKSGPAAPGQPIEQASAKVPVEVKKPVVVPPEVKKPVALPPLEIRPRVQPPAEPPARPDLRVIPKPPLPGTEVKPLVPPVPGKLPVPEVKIPPEKRPEAGEKKPEAQKKTVYDGANFNEALKAAKDQGLPVVFKVGSPSCPPCNRFDRELGHSLEDQYKGKAIVIKVNNNTNPDVGEKLGVSSLPTFGVGHVDATGKLTIDSTWTGYGSPNGVAASQGINQWKSYVDAGIRAANSKLKK
ncbi:MAG: hypothetical protein IAF58_22420 [Leptolyngbya sp.]|nr:hypothetical protein [Candidatus Melainabacteria bacterium]